MRAAAPRMILRLTSYTGLFSNISSAMLSSTKGQLIAQATWQTFLLLSGWFFIAVKVPATEQQARKKHATAARALYFLLLPLLLLLLLMFCIVKRRCA